MPSYDLIPFLVCIDLAEPSESSFACELVLRYEVLLLLTLRFAVCRNRVENVMMQEQLDFGSIHGVVKESRNMLNCGFHRASMGGVADEIPQEF